MDIEEFEQLIKDNNGELTPFKLWTLVAKDNSFLDVVEMLMFLEDNNKIMLKDNKLIWIYDEEV